MANIDFLSSLHTGTKRDYVQRVVEYDKAECAEIAKQWGFDYWDGDRKYGFGGMRYDGRWLPIAQKMATHYGLKAGDKILDAGCGKAFLLHEFTQAVPGIEIAGLDISQYGIDNAKKETRPFLKTGNCTELPYADNEFDFVYSLNTFHNLKNFELMAALKEMQRVGKKNRYICVESYRNESEKANLLYWQLTCETFYGPDEWQWFYDQAGYEGDSGFIYFE
ncbi:MAG TPA: class I SAM-dependent methyltransferase [Rhodospirillales bacterium]|jgi:SAM-dependent methyltransferase|nr:class I SAM-dependent methyltransferase [Rhodospirillales bacterium]